MSSYVNKEISLFNKKLEKCLKSFNGVSLIKTNYTRENSNRPGMYLNSLSKVNVLKATNNKQLVGGIFCDFHKAFDCVSHDILIKKLEFYGITGKFGALLKSYFKGRYQRVNLGANNSINSFLSSWAEIKFGVPQGSILGPLLFLLYIKDITKVSVNWAKIFLYADDTSINVTNSAYDDYKSAINKIFYKVNTWFRTNLLKLNITKTHILQFITMYQDDHGSITTSVINNPLTLSESNF
jgi:hypothetical protein